MRAMLTKVAAVLAGTVLVGGSTTSLAQASPSAVRWCGDQDLTASFHATDAAMSHAFGKIVLRNTSQQACRTGGFGGLSYVGHGDGSQIGAAADRTPGGGRVVTLAPGQRVVSPTSEATYSVYPRRECRPQEVDGFRVYVPSSTRSQFVAHPTTGCANPAVHLLSHRAYHRPRGHHPGS